MRIASVSVIRNEQDVIESFVRHNAHLLDEMCIILHRCRDGTRDILRALLAEGFRLRVFEDLEHGFKQADRINALARRMFKETNADFVIPLDADEFLIAGSREHLEQELSKILPGEGGLMRLQTYVPTEADSRDEPCVLRRVTHRFDIGPPPAATEPIGAEAWKVVVGRGFADRPDEQIFEGNHLVLKAGTPAAHRRTGLELAHFPVRSLPQLHRKVVLGWVGYLAAHADPKAKGLGAHWRRLYDDLKVKGEPGWKDILEFSTLYLPGDKRETALVQSPAARHGGELRFVALQHPQPLITLLLDEVEGMARQLSAR